MLVITEGEIDAMSYAQATGCQWPVVSLPNGAQSAAKAIREELEWVEKFQKVIIWFDNDEPGKKAADEVAALLTPGKAHVVFAPSGYKDANDMLVAGQDTALKANVWNATVYRPDGVMNASDLLSEVLKPVEMATPYPWKAMNDVLYGLRPREIVTFAAGSGIGKSAIVAEIAYYLAQNGETIGRAGA